MAHLINFSFEFFYEIFTEDASLLFLYHEAKKSKMTKNPNQGGGGSCLKATVRTDTVDGGWSEGERRERSEKERAARTNRR